MSQSLKGIYAPPKKKKKNKKINKINKKIKFNKMKNKNK